MVKETEYQIVVYVYDNQPELMEHINTMRVGGWELDNVWIHMLKVRYKKNVI
jgi:hypothetical protein